DQGNYRLAILDAIGDMTTTGHQAGLDLDMGRLSILPGYDGFLGLADFIQLPAQGGGDHGHGLGEAHMADDVAGFNSGCEFLGGSPYALGLHDGGAKGREVVDAGGLDFL